MPPYVVIDLPFKVVESAPRVIALYIRRRVGRLGKIILIGIPVPRIQPVKLIVQRKRKFIVRERTLYIQFRRKARTPIIVAMIIPVRIAEDAA